MSQRVIHWHLKEVMKQRGFRSAASLHKAMKERGILISKVQLSRTVNALPVRLNTGLLLALCDVLDCTPANLLTLQPSVREEPMRKPARRKVDSPLAAVKDIIELVGPRFQLRRTVVSGNDD